MKTLSIKLKVILGVSTCLMVAAALLIGLVRGSYRRNVDMVARNALETAIRSYENLKSDRAAVIEATTAVVVNVDSLRQTFIGQNRNELLEKTKPIFDELKKQGSAEHLLYLDVQGNAFLRMHNPKAFGDKVPASFLAKAMQTQTPVTGFDLVAAGFVIGGARPYYDSASKLIGYVICGGPLDNFLATMKRQTSDDYKMVGFKKLVNEDTYHKTQQKLGLQDRWAQFANVITFSETSASIANADYDSEAQNVPASGKLLGEATIGDREYIRGVFPLTNALGQTTGGIFVRHDVTELYNGMQRVQNLAIATILVVLLVVSVMLFVILNKLVFARLKQTMDTATRVVGGDFERQIIPVSNDEVGKLEALLEQFRAIFVNVVNELQQANDSNARK